MIIDSVIPLWTAPKLWPGETVVCIGGGPSLTHRQVSNVLMADSNVIAINDAYRVAPWAAVLYASDKNWWDWHKGASEFEGIKVGLRGSKDGAGYQGEWNGDDWPDVKAMAHNGVDGLELLDARFLRTGANSGYQAINLAVHFGAKRIILLGYDMQSIVVAISQEVKAKISEAIKDESDVIKSAIMASVSAVRVDHWFGAHPDNITSHPFAEMLEAFDSLKSIKQLTGVEIINCSPGSALEVFPKRDLEEALNDQG